MQGSVTLKCIRFWQFCMDTPLFNKPLQAPVLVIVSTISDMSLLPCKWNSWFKILVANIHPFMFLVSHCSSRTFALCWFWHYFMLCNLILSNKCGILLYPMTDQHRKKHFSPCFLHSCVLILYLSFSFIFNTLFGVECIEFYLVTLDLV